MRAGTLFAICLLAPALAAGDQIYRSTDDQGNPLFTDEAPSEDASPVTLDPLTTVPADEALPQLQLGSSADGDTSEDGQSQQSDAYTGIQVSYPPADQAVRHNGGMVPFRVTLQPEGKSLEPGHRVEILLDGSVRGSGASEQVSVSPVHRGSHTVVARVVDDSGTPLVASAPIDFHLLRASIGND